MRNQCFKSQVRTSRVREREGTTCTLTTPRDRTTRLARSRVVAGDRGGATATATAAHAIPRSILIRRTACGDLLRSLYVVTRTTAQVLPHAEIGPAEICGDLLRSLYVVTRTTARTTACGDWSCGNLLRSPSDETPCCLIRIWRNPARSVTKLRRSVSRTFSV